MNTNSVILTGNLTKNLEFKYSQNGTAYADGSIAVNEKDKVIFVNFRAFGKYAETMSEYLRKGSKILIQGKLDISEYQGKFYTKVLVNSVEFLGSKPQSNETKVKEKEIPLDNQGFPLL